MTFTPDPEYYHGVMFIYLIGVEKGYEGKGYCRRMLRWSERAARKLGIEELAIANIISDRLRDIVEKHGYAERDHFYGTWFKKVRA